MERISEIAPPIPDSVISTYKSTFKHSSVAKPIIANGLDEIVIFRTDNSVKKSSACSTPIISPKPEAVQINKVSIEVLTKK